MCVFAAGKTQMDWLYDGDRVPVEVNDISTPVPTGLDSSRLITSMRSFPSRRSMATGDQTNIFCLQFASCRVWPTAGYLSFGPMEQ